MIDINQIRMLHIELSTNCNASCPMCPRNLHGAPFNAGYPISELRLTDIQKMFPVEFLLQIKKILFNGNLGDFMLAKDGIEIVEYFKQANPTIEITINTNGSARNQRYWERLGQLGVTVLFDLDGLKGTHERYRKDTNFDTVIKNAQYFINAGGVAWWKMILFDHNRHEIEQCRTLAKSLNFAKFELIDHGRSNGVVFDKDRNYLYTIGEHPGTGHTLDELESWARINFHSKEYYAMRTVSKKINCETIRDRSIYITGNGEVYPCCYLGVFPRTYDPELHQGNDQIKALLENRINNALEQPLEKCLEWFNQVQASWEKTSFEDGRLYRCDLHCGSV